VYDEGSASEGSAVSSLLRLFGRWLD
jgi:hypothetical protein